MKQKDTKTFSDWDQKSICVAKNIQSINCHDSESGFSYHLEIGYDPGKSFRIITVNHDDKCAFVESLYRCLAAHYPNYLPRIRFNNLTDNLTSRLEALQKGENSLNDKSTVLDNVLDDIATSANYSSKSTDADVADCVLTEKEQRDIDKFLSDDSSVMDASAFVLDLRQKLSIIDGENVHSIMSSEEQVRTLMTTLNTSLEELELLDSRMAFYDQLLADVEVTMSSLTNRDALLQLSSENSIALLNTLNDLLNRLTLDPQKLEILERARLDTPKDIVKCTEAAWDFLRLLKNPLSEGLKNLDAANECMEELKKCHEKFAQKFTSQINNICITKKMEFEDLVSQSPNYDSTGGGRHILVDLHQSRWRSLTPYTSLTQWYREYRPNDISLLIANYVRYTQPLYDAELKYLLNEMRTFHAPSRTMRGGGGGGNLAVPGASNMRSGFGGSSSSVNHPPTSTSTPVAPVREKRVNSTVTGGDTDSLMDDSGYSWFHKKFDLFLRRIKQMILDEEEFCANFFGFVNENKEERINFMTKLFPKLKDDILSTIGFLEQCQYAGGAAALSSNVTGSTTTLMMTNTDTAVQPANAFYSMDMLVIVSQENDAAVKSSLSLNVLWWSWMIAIKKSFNELINHYKTLFSSYQAYKKARCGILSVVKEYERFTEAATVIFRDSNRLSDLEKAHVTLATELMCTIARVAFEHGKTPSAVVLMENLHRLKSILRPLKMTSLKDLKIEVTRKYDDALNEYVASCVGCPFEKLHIFIKQIDETIASGRKPQDIEFLAKFSKQNLKKVIDEYPPKEVKRGLEALSKRVQKHLSPDSGLFEVVWRYIQVEFMRLRDRYEQRITDCYHGPNIQLAFSKQDLELFFKDISKSH